MLTHVGEVMEEKTVLKAVGLRYFRQRLRERLSPVMAREMLNLASILDCLVTGQIALAADTTVQRMKALESIAAGAAYHIAQRMELVRSEFSLMANRGGGSGSRVEGGVQDPDHAEGALGADHVEGQPRRVHGEVRRQEQEQRERKRQRAEGRRQGQDKGGTNERSASPHRERSVG